jgi:hypothetical protein
MELSPSWEATSRSDIQEFSTNIMFLDIIYRPVFI